MKRLAFPATVLLAGLALSQVLFTVLVHISSVSYHEKLIALKQAGYLVIPNEHVMPTLLQWGPAFCGAVFFTLTVGAGLTFLAFYAAWGEKILFHGSRLYRICLVLLWLVVAGACNAKGLNIPVSIVFIILPAAVFLITKRWMPQHRLKSGGKMIAAHLVAVIIAAVAWTPQLDRDVFINIRDHILLNNSIGKSVNAFYYQYTLYPTQFFNALDQKLLKACAITETHGDARKSRLIQNLIQYDYLPVPPAAPHHLRISLESKTLQFSTNATPSWHIETARFFADPGQVLQHFAEVADNNQIFRKFTFFSLLSAFPLSFYIIAHLVFTLLLWLIPSPALRSMTASGVCLLIAVLAIIPLSDGGAKELNRTDINTLLNQNDWRQQRNALKYIADERKTPLAYNLNPDLLINSPHVPVRYWLAQSLGAADGTRAVNLLAQLLDDSQPNVVCMAYYSLGRIGNPKTVALILNRIPDIRHWYTQRYAYNALRRMGWKQTVSVMK